MLGVAPVVVVLAGLALVTPNLHAYHELFNDDVQDPVESTIRLRFTVALVAVTGLWVGHLMAFVTGLLYGAAKVGPPTLRGRLAAATRFGVLLAMVGLVVGLLAAGQVAPGLAQADARRWEHPALSTWQLFTFDGTRRLLVAGFVAYPLWSALGVGAGALWRRARPITVWWCLLGPSLVWGAGMVGLFQVPVRSNWAILPQCGYVTLADEAFISWRSVLVGLAGLACCALALNALAQRRHRPRSADGAASGLVQPCEHQVR